MLGSVAVVGAAVFVFLVVVMVRQGLVLREDALTRGIHSSDDGWDDWLS